MTTATDPSPSIDIMFSFDTTGSMAPALAQVRRTVRQTIQRLFREIPNLRIGILAHGDYCDAGSTYVTTHQDICNNLDALVRFVETVTPTGGGDAPECYELVLRQAQGFGWRADAQKVLVVIGDDLPHTPHANPQRINWRDEIMALVHMGVTIYGVQALGRRHATPFYRELAERSGGFHVPLDQFAQVTDMLLAVTYRQQGEDRVVAFAEEVTAAGRMTRSMSRTLNALTPRITALSELTSDQVRTHIGASVPAGEAYPSLTAADLLPVPPSRFQALEVDADTPIRAFAESNGLLFRPGRGFYQFIKAETIQARKEVVLVDRRTGDMFSGDAARAMLGLPRGANAHIRPGALDQYDVFVQSTSYNRVLKRHTRFLYEMEDWDHGVEWRAAA
jgi:hypothetical protein